MRSSEADVSSARFGFSLPQGNFVMLSVTMRLMNRRQLLQSLPAVAFVPGALPISPESSTMVYELRIYHAHEGKLDALLARFRDHTMALFERHGMKNIAYWLPTDDPLKGNTLVYMLAHPSREAATANWKAFQNDPEWQSVKQKSEAAGPLVDKVDSTFLVLTEFSPPLR
jgi:NIPSNAP